MMQINFEFTLNKYQYIHKYVYTACGLYCLWQSVCQRLEGLHFVRFTSQMFSSTYESLQDEARLLLL